MSLSPFTAAELAAAARRLKDRAEALLAKGWHAPYFTRGDVAEWSGEPPAAVPAPPAEEQPPADLVHVGTFPALTLSDRCDRCVALSVVVTRLRASGYRLDWCKHHFEEFEPVLMPLVDRIRDERDRLTP